MEDLGMHRASAKFVPRLLTYDQKLQKSSIYENFFQRANDGVSHLKNVITGDDDTLVCHCDLEINISPHAGRVLLDITLRKYDRYADKRNQCCLFLLVIKALCIMNLLLKVRQSEMCVGCGTKKVA
jgi:hypothetical protein